MNRLCFLLMIAQFTMAQSTRGQAMTRNLVFEGAGIRGIAYSGAIGELEQRHLLDSIERVGGTSSGAITALLVSLGYTSQEISTIVLSTPFKKFNDGRFFFFGGVHRFRRFFGWYRGRQVEKWITGLINSKTGNGEITFRELKERGFRDLYVTGTCLNKQALLLFSHEAYPLMKVRDAVRISMSIPLYYEAVFIDGSGKVVYHPKDKTGLDVMVDGGFTGNFPIHIFDSTKYMNATGQNQFAVNRQTLAFRIDRGEQVAHDSITRIIAPFMINGLKDYMRAFYNIIVENLNRQSLTDDDWSRTVSIDDGNVGPRVRKLSREELDILMTNGAIACKKYLNQQTVKRF